MKRHLLLGLVSIPFLLSLGLAQQKTRVFDSFGPINAEDASARLDNFAIALMNEPYHLAYIVAYGPEGEGGGTGQFLIKVAKDYLVNSRGIEPARVQTIYAGRYKNPFDVYVQLWILPSGVALPTPRRYNSTLKPFSGKMFESSIGDSFGSYDECCDPGFGDYELAAFADVLLNQQRSVGYLVAFNLETATPGSWRRGANLQAETLKARGIDAGRIKIIFGGAAKRRKDEYGQVKLQHWILPADAPPPVKEAKPERTPKEAVQLALIDTFFLADVKNAGRVLQDIVDTLHADSQLRICFIIRSELPTGEAYDPVPTKVDEVKLVEKWKAELIEKNGIKEHRIFVINPGPAEVGVSGVEVWFVPIGAAFPDPHAAESEEPEPLD